MGKKDIKKIEITHKTILFTLFVLGVVWFVVSIREVVLVVFVATLIATAVVPVVNALERKKIPRPLSASLTLLVTFFTLIGVVVSVVPVVINQLNTFIVKLPELLSVTAQQYPWLDLELSASSQLATIPSGLFRVAVNTLTAVVFIVTSLIISFYLIVDRKGLDLLLEKLFGDEKDEANRVVVAIEAKLGNWVRGQIIVMLAVGLLTYIGLSIIGIDYALPLAIIASLLELLPNIGPTAASVPAIIIGLAISPLHGFIVALLYIIIQQVESLLITPQIMRRVVNLHPIVTIVSILAGLRLGGVILAVLSLPIVLTAQILLGEMHKRKMGIFDSSGKRSLAR
jgi:predicted PurR-regulated permease PerM